MTFFGGICKNTLIVVSYGMVRRPLVSAVQSIEAWASRPNKLINAVVIAISLPNFLLLVVLLSLRRRALFEFQMIHFAVHQRATELNWLAAVQVGDLLAHQ